MVAQAPSESSLSFLDGGAPSATQHLDTYTPARTTTFFDDLNNRLRANPAIRLLSMTGPQSGNGWCACH
jgi:hypothetical protein